MPLKGGCRATEAPVEWKMLFGVVEIYNSAVIVIEEPIRSSDTSLLKYAAREVIVPSLGTEKAKLITGANIDPVRSMVPFTMGMFVAELPKPMMLAFPISPPAMVVIMTGAPEAKGIIAPAPPGPGGPCGPTGP
mgnify:FL=1